MYGIVRLGGALSVYVGRGEYFQIRFLLINVVFEWFSPHNA